ncbi:MAG: PEP-CTERM sorting domain-containing protein [Steroidobacteraceae bacterium]
MKTKVSFFAWIGGATLAAALSLGSAQAAVFDFSYSTLSGGALSSSGSGELLATPEGGGSYLVTSATGMIDGSLLSLVPQNGFAGNDNLIFPTSSPELDFSGISFAANSISYNLYYDNGTYVGPGYAACTKCGSGGNETLVNFSLTAAGTSVPEPGSLALFGLGLVAVALSRRRFAR